MKKIFLVLSVFICSMLISTSALAQEEVTVYVNGNKIVSDVPAVVENGSTMLPFRAILNALGVKNEDIQWHESSKSMEIWQGNKYIFLLIGSRGAVVEDRLITLSVAPYISNERTMIPVRFISEALGASVDWDGETHTVTITK